MAFKILIMGLPGSGKTTLAKELIQYFRDHSIDPEWLNADVVRTRFNDWDFTESGRIRQSHRMAESANQSMHNVVICDFVAPLQAQRDIFNPDYLVWMDTITEGRFEDTNKAFIPPVTCSFKVTSLDAHRWAQVIGLDVITRTTPRRSNV